MRRYLGDIVRRARKERGLTQKQLIDDIGEQFVSIRTLRRIEKGYLNVRYEAVDILQAYFDIEFRYRLRDEYEEQIVKSVLSGDSSVKECIEEINGRIAEYRTFFHGEPNPLHDFPITNLAEFLIYLPLINREQLNEVLIRIGGLYSGNAYYILDKLEYLYKEIPKTEVKEIADYLAKQSKKPELTVPYEDCKLYLKLLEDRASEERMYFGA